MEIEFNPSRVTKRESTEPVARRKAVTSTSNETPTESIDALKRKLNEIPLVRPEKVEAGKASVSSVKYPPEELMDGIANLLAKQIVE